MDELFDSLENCVNAINTIETVKAHRGRKCPHCGESYYMEKYSTRTAVYYPPIFKDGININPDRNITTTYCTCMNCGKDFSYEGY